MDYSLSPWLRVSSLLACTTGFRLASPHNCISQFLEINLCIYVCIAYWFCFSRDPWLIQGGRCLLVRNSLFECIGNTRFGNGGRKPGSQGEGLRGRVLRPSYLRRNSTPCPEMRACKRSLENSPSGSSDAWGTTSRSSLFPLLFVSYLQCFVLRWRGYFQSPVLLSSDQDLLVQGR